MGVGVVMYDLPYLIAAGYVGNLCKTVGLSLTVLGSGESSSLKISGRSPLPLEVVPSPKQ